MATKDEACPCMDLVAKVQVRNILVSWVNRRNEEVAVMEKESVVPKEWIEKYKIVIDAVAKEVERIDETPECPLEEENPNSNDTKQ